MRYLTIAEVETVVANYFRRDVVDLHNHSRAEPIAWIRGIVLSLAHEYSAFSENDCAQYFGLKRGGAYHAVRRVQTRVETCPRDRRDVEECRAQLQALFADATRTPTDFFQTWLVLEGGSAELLNNERSA